MEEKKYKFTLKKFWLHLKTIIKHKHYVFIYCCLCGMPIRGLVHDLSKFSPAEFFSNVKYTEKGVSPIDTQKKVIGYSFSWQHHKGHNPHHYEYWMDKFDDGCYVHRIPEKYMIEMLCDFLAANRAYNSGKASYANEFNWWKNQRTIKNMHPDNTKFLDIVLKMMYELENGASKTIFDNENTQNGENVVYEFKKPTDVLCRSFLKSLYKEIISCSKNEQVVKIRQPKLKETNL